MTNKEFWLKLFSENETALASAIILCERFVSMQQLESGKEYVEAKKRELSEEAPQELVRDVFPDFDENQKNSCQNCKCRATERCPVTYYGEDGELVCADLGEDGYCSSGDFESL
mgnify:CR=1 FL=1